MIEFKNRFPQLSRWNDRICDSDTHPDYDPSDSDTPKYEVFLAKGWAWEKPADGRDCYATESFRTLAQARTALRHAVRMDFTQDPCRSCPHLKNGECTK